MSERGGSHVTQTLPSPSPVAGEPIPQTHVLHIPESRIIFEDLLWSTASAYLDDITVKSLTTPEEHVLLLNKIFRILHEANLPLKEKKCAILATIIKLLGSIVSGECIAPDDSKFDKLRVHIDNPCKNVKDVQQIVGLLAWFRRFIPAFSAKLRPVTRLLSPSVPFNWSPTHQESVNSIINEILTTSSQSHMVFGLVRTIHLDLGDENYIATISQLPADPPAMPELLYHESQILKNASARYTRRVSTGPFP